MTLAPAELSAALQPVVDRALSRLAQALPEPSPADLLPLLTRLAVASDFALDTLVRQPALLAQLAARVARRSRRRCLTRCSPVIGRHSCGAGVRRCPRG